MDTVYPTMERCVRVAKTIVLVLLEKQKRPMIIEGEAPYSYIHTINNITVKIAFIRGKTNNNIHQVLL